MSQATMNQLSQLIQSLRGMDNVTVSLNIMAMVDLAGTPDVRVEIGAAPDTTAPDTYDIGTPGTRDDFPVGTNILWTGEKFRGFGSVIQHNVDGSISVRINDILSNSEKRVNLTAADIASGNLQSTEQSTDYVPSPDEVMLTAADFPVGTRIRWCGQKFVGAGVVAKHNPDGSISVRIDDQKTDTKKRVNLNAGDIASGNLSTIGD